MMVNGSFKLIRLSLSKYIIPPHSLRYGVLTMVLACAVGIKAVINGFSPPIDKFYTIPVKNLPDYAENFKIVLLADLHISAPTTEQEIIDIVKRTNDHKPDLIVIAGDFVDGQVHELDYMTRHLSDLKAKYGVYAVSGNHEMYSGYMEWL